MKLITCSQFKVVVPRKTWEKIFYFARRAAPNEYQALGTVTSAWVNDVMVFTIGDIYLIDQRVAGGQAMFEEKALASFISEFPNTQDLWFWVHSHVNMGVFWSSTDKGTVDRFSSLCGHVLSMVVCCDGTYKIRYDVEEKNIFSKHETFSYVPRKFALDDVPAELEPYFSEEERVVLDSEFDAHILPMPLEVSATSLPDSTTRRSPILSLPDGVTPPRFTYSRTSLSDWEFSSRDSLVPSKRKGGKGKKFPKSLKEKTEATEPELACISCEYYESPVCSISESYVNDPETESCPLWTEMLPE